MPREDFKNWPKALLGGGSKDAFELLKPCFKLMNAFLFHYVVAEQHEGTAIGPQTSKKQKR